MSVSTGNADDSELNPAAPMIAAVGTSLFVGSDGIDAYDWSVDADSRVNPSDPSFSDDALPARFAPSASDCHDVPGSGQSSPDAVT